MKVIKVGKKNNCSMRVTCKKCDAVLEIESTDLTQVPVSRGFDKEYLYTCPCCKKEQHLFPHQLSKELLFEMTQH